jgi:hypothetical protein
MRPQTMICKLCQCYPSNISTARIISTT